MGGLLTTAAWMFSFVVAGLLTPEKLFLLNCYWAITHINADGQLQLEGVGHTWSSDSVFTPLPIKNAKDFGYP